MLIVHLVGGVIIFASFLLRMPEASSALSLFFTVFKSVAPVSFLQRIEYAFPLSPASINSPSFYSDVVFSPSPTVTELAVYYPPFRHVNLSPPASPEISAAVTQEVDQEKRFPSLNSDEKPAPTPTAYFNIFLFLVPPCAILTLYLTYVSHQRS